MITFSGCLDFWSVGHLVPEAPWESIADKCFDRKAHERKTRREAESMRRAMQRGHTERQEEAPCKGCGKRFENRPKGWIRTFCDNDCRRDYFNAQQSKKRAKSRITVTNCEECKTPLLPTGKRLGRPRRFCGEPCAKRWKRKHEKEMKR